MCFIMLSNVCVCACRDASSSLRCMAGEDRANENAAEGRLIRQRAVRWRTDSLAPVVSARTLRWGNCVTQRYTVLLCASSSLPCSLCASVCVLCLPCLPCAWRSVFDLWLSKKGKGPNFCARVCVCVTVRDAATTPVQPVYLRFSGENTTGSCLRVWTCCCK